MGMAIAKINAAAYLVFSISPNRLITLLMPAHFAAVDRRQLDDVMVFVLREVRHRVLELRQANPLARLLYIHFGRCPCERRPVCPSMFGDRMEYTFAPRRSE